MSHTHKSQFDNCRLLLCVCGIDCRFQSLEPSSSLGGISPTDCVLKSRRHIEEFSLPNKTNDL